MSYPTDPSGRAAARRRRAGRHSQSARRQAGHTLYRREANPIQVRIAALVGVVAAVTGIWIVSVAAGAPTRPAAAVATDGVSIAAADASSSSLFCAGGASGFGGLAGTTIYLTNTTPQAVTGVMTARVAPGTGSGATSTGTPGPPTVRPVQIPPMGTTAINPGTGLAAGDVAASFVFAGGGVTANQVVTGTGGWSTAPCASQVATSWYFAGGSTSPGNALTLDLFNPTSTDAVMNVSFLTAAGVITPSAYQGLVVPAGHVVAENVGDFVQNQGEIGTMISAQSTAVVADELQQWSSGSTGGLALRLGSPSPATVWHFAQTTNPGKATVTFHVANPGSQAGVATFDIGVPSASIVPIQVPVPAQSEVALIASASSRLPRTEPYSVTVKASVGMVVSRSVQAPNGSAPPLWGSISGTTTTSPHWLVPGPGAGTAPGTPRATAGSLAVANSGSSPAQVRVTTLGTGTVVSSFSVAPGSLAVLGPNVIAGLQVYDVKSTQPVTVEEDDNPSGAPGVVSSAGMPFSS
ncbi:MAG TPA: DUF5719 family protein [Acidimicrobiales bacterium]|jgi:hypothetical protein|nr:DUF5719 family protein [Acidimicrobiales bacterium]